MINEKKSYGNFTNLRGITINTIQLIGSYFVVEFKSIKPFYAIQGLIVSSLFFYTIFLVEERRKEKIIYLGTESIFRILSVLRFVFEPSVIVPFSLFWLNGLIPSLGSAQNYLLLAKGGWTLAAFGFQTLCFGIL